MKELCAKDHVKKPADLELRLTAIHEAGHGVAHIRFKIDQHIATIKPNNNIAGSVSANADARTEAEAIDQVMSYCWGYAACVAAGFAEDQAKGGCDLDFDTAQRLIKIWSLAELSHWQSEAVELMRRSENLRPVDLIGQYLIQHGTIDDESNSAKRALTSQNWIPAVGDS